MSWRIIFDFLFKVMFSVLFCYGSFRFFESIQKGLGIIGFLISFGFCGRLFSRELLEFVLLFKHWGEKSAVFQWHGKYYSFDGRQIRFFWLDDVVWIPLKDLKKVIEPKIAAWELQALAGEFGKIPETQIQGLTEAGLMQILESRTGDRRASYRMIRFKRWLMHEALVNVKRMPRSAINQPYVKS
jgi:hypothetical protein